MRWIANGRASNRFLRLRSLRASAEDRTESNIGRADRREDGLVKIMESFNEVSNALRDLECVRDLCCDWAGEDFFIEEVASSPDKHNAVGKPDSKKDDGDFVGTPRADNSESGSS